MIEIRCGEIMNHLPTHHKFALSDHEQFVLLREGDAVANESPLFCIHPSGGDIGIYRKLAKRMDSRLPVIGVRPSRNASEQSSIDQMALQYHALISAKCPNGPIRLLGFSLGGFIAMAIAHRFEQENREIGFLGLVDSDLRWASQSELAKEELALRISQISKQLRDTGVLPNAEPEKIDADIQDIVEMFFD